MEYFTDAPALLVRQVAGIYGCGFYVAGLGEPAWVETVLEGRGRALEHVIDRLITLDFRVEPEGKPAISNPTYAFAAARIDRGQSSAPAAAYPR